MSEKKDTAFFANILREEICLVANQDPNLEEITPDEITDDVILYDLGIDSIDLIEVMISVQKKSEGAINFKNRAIDQTLRSVEPTIGDLAKALVELANKS